MRVPTSGQRLAIDKEIAPYLKEVIQKQGDEMTGFAVSVADSISEKILNAAAKAVETAADISDFSISDAASDSGMRMNQYINASESYRLAAVLLAKRFLKDFGADFVIPIE